MAKQKYFNIDIDKCEYVGGDGVEYELWKDKYDGTVYRVTINILETGVYRCSYQAQIVPPEIKQEELL
tara:strand:- start:327 stop:530 length:204 start_codon:yes stop_codon:yes gene_type:complete